MSHYSALRTFADSYGLAFMTLLFLVLIGWTFRRNASAHHRDAANMIFEQEEDDRG